jgi:hypothetical protein
MENPENTERAIENGESRGSSNKTNKKKRKQKQSKAQNELDIIMRKQTQIA